MMPMENMLQLMMSIQWSMLLKAKLIKNTLYGFRRILKLLNQFMKLLFQMLKLLTLMLFSERMIKENSSGCYLMFQKLAKINLNQHQHQHQNQLQ